MNVTLIRPPAYSVGLMGPQLVPFLGIVYVAAALRQAGHAVQVIDMCGEDIDHTEIVDGRYVQYGLSFPALSSRLKNPDVIGFSCMFSQDWPFHRRLIQFVRKLFPSSVIMAGGEHITALPEFSLRDCPELDVGVLGEGEETSVRLLAALAAQKDLAEVPGLVFRRAGSRDIERTARASRVKNIDDLPVPAWDLIPLENYLSRGLNYHIRRGRTMPMLATRGCPYQCTFCSNTKMWGAPWIARDPEKVVAEMAEYIARYRVDNFVFSDLAAVVTKEKIIRLCQEILKCKIRVTWQLPTLRTEAVDREVLELMHQAGCRDLDFAIESASPDVLASVKKKNDPTRIAALIKDALSLGMNLSTNIVIGLPREGWRDFFKTYKLLMKMAVWGQQEVNVFPFVPYPGSKLFDEYLDAGKITLGDSYFLSIFGYADLSSPISWSPHFGPRTLSGMRVFLMASFYSLMFLTHPKRLWRLITNAVHGRTTTKLEGVLGRVFMNLKNSRRKK